MDYIISPEVNAQVAEWFGEAPANSQGLRPDRGQELLRRPTTPPTRPTPTRSGTGPRRSSSASTGARTSSAPTTPMDPGLDRDQGLTDALHGRSRPRRAPAGRSAGSPPGCTATRAAAGRPAVAPMAVARAWPTSARSRRCSSPRSGPRTASPATWSASSTLDNFRDLVHRRRSTATSRCARVGVARRGHGHRRRDRAADGASTWPRSPRRAARRLLVIAVLTPLWASYLVKAYAWRVHARQRRPGRLAARPVGLDTPGYGLTATDHRRWPTCGCRT